MKRAGLLAAALAVVLMGAAQPASGVSTPLAPREKVDYVTGSNTSTGGHTVIEGDRLYVGAYGLGMRIFDISDPAAPEEIGSYFAATEPEVATTTGPLRADAVPDAAVFDGRHIAILNGTNRTSGSLPAQLRTQKSEFLDVTDPANPELLWTLDGPANGEAHNGDIFDARRLWLPSGGSGVNGLRIYDLEPVLGSPPAAPANLFRANPVELWKASPHYRPPSDGRAEPGFTHTHDITIYPDYVVVTPEGKVKRDIILLAEGGSYTNDNGNTGSVFIIDITDAENPVVMQRWLHERGPGHHPIRYHHEAQFLAGNRHVMLVTDEDLHNGCGNAGGVVAVQITANLTRSVELSEWFIPAGTPAPVCSVHVFDSHGYNVFIGSYNAGLQIVNYRDPRNPTRVGFYQTEGSTAWGALWHQGVVYVGDMTRGLDVFRYTGRQKG